MTKELSKPIERSKIRKRFGYFYYGLKRKILWLKYNKMFASTLNYEKLPFIYYHQQSLLMRQLKDVDMWYQHNKVKNLKIATKTMNGLILKPGQVMSYWKLIGKPTKSKGYVKGMILSNGTFKAGVGGGLCQLSNLIFWITIHTPLTIKERHRHGYDVFPDSNRTRPFGSGATCFYPHGDLMIANDTKETYQLIVELTDEHLVAEWRVSHQPQIRYEIEERNHEMKPEYWGGYGRYNQLYQLAYDTNNNLISERLIVQNAAIMMYDPFISYNGK